MLKKLSAAGDSLIVCVCRRGNDSLRATSLGEKCVNKTHDSHDDLMTKAVRISMNQSKCTNISVQKELWTYGMHHFRRNMLRWRLRDAGLAALNLQGGLQQLMALAPSKSALT